MMNFEATACIRRGRGTTAAATVNLDFRGNVGHVTSMRTLTTQPPMKETSAGAFIGFVASTEGSLIKKENICKIVDHVIEAKLR